MESNNWFPWFGSIFSTLTITGDGINKDYDDIKMS